jgi:purine-binding chemotaxis protein CheW
VIGAAETGTPTRFATVRLGDRTLALAVDAVVGVRSLDAVQLQQLPPLLRAASCDVVEAIGTLDEQLLVVLRAGRILDEAMWRKVEASEAPQ